MQYSFWIIDNAIFGLLDNAIFDSPREEETNHPRLLFLQIVTLEFIDFVYVQVSSHIL